MAGAAFGEALKRLRAEKGFSQSQLARKAGVHAMAISQIERGKRQPKWETILALAEALGVTCEAFTQAPAPAPPVTARRPRKGKGK